MFEGKDIEVMFMAPQHIGEVAKVHEMCFERQMCSEKWVRCNQGAYPMIHCYITRIEGEIAGYIFWEEKAGFRSNVVLELKQVAVHPEFRRRGIARYSIEWTFREIELDLNLKHRAIKGVIVTTRADNAAQKLYTNVLGVKIIAAIPELYSADEVIMVAKREEIPIPLKPPWEE